MISVFFRELHQDDPNAYDALTIKGTPERLEAAAEYLLRCAEAFRKNGHAEAQASFSGVITEVTDTARRIPKYKSEVP